MRRGKTLRTGFGLTPWDGFRSVNGRLLASSRPGVYCRFANADSLSKLSNILRSRGRLARRGGAVGSLCPLPGGLVCAPATGGDRPHRLNAAAASAQYQRGAATSQNAPGSGFAAGAPSADDDTVDPNLAARAAGLSHVAFDDPSLGAGAGAARMDETDSVVAYDAPPLAPEDESPAQVRPVVGADPAEDIETVAARRARREMNGRARRGRRPSVGVVIALLLAVNVVAAGLALRRGAG